ncbi:MAG: DUF1870 family protein [Rhodocyclaceae bacterium]|nr:DUF1870 family protein [Rhodocyclaceae bacterium]
MTPSTLQALRRLLFFSVEEAALLIGDVSPRSWQYWERGERSIPDDVAETITRLCDWRDQAIWAAEETIRGQKRARKGAPDLVMVWYQTLDDWATLPQREPLLWRPQCSVVAEIAARHGATLVTFDGPAYAAWLGGREDTEVLRSAWAGEVG